jgi:hypothetical protein
VEIVFSDDKGKLRRALNQPCRVAMALHCRPRTAVVDLVAVTHCIVDYPASVPVHFATVTVFWLRCESHKNNDPVRSRTRHDQPAAVPAYRPATGR